MISKNCKFSAFRLQFQILSSQKVKTISETNYHSINCPYAKIRRTLTSSTCCVWSSINELWLFLAKKSWVIISRISAQKTASSRTSPDLGSVYLTMGISNWIILYLLGLAICKGGSSTSRNSAKCSSLMYWQPFGRNLYIAKNQKLC